MHLVKAVVLALALALACVCLCSAQITQCGTKVSAAAPFPGTIAQSAPIDISGCGTHVMIAAYVGRSPSATGIAFTDTCGNAFQLAPDTPNEDGDTKLWMYFVIGATLCNNEVFTCNGHGCVFTATVWTGVASGVDKHSASQGTCSGGGLTTGSITPTNDNELVLTGSTGDNAATYTAAPSPPLITQDAIPFNGGYNGNEGLISASVIQTSKTAINPTFTLCGSGAATVNSFFSVLTPAPLTVTITTLPEGFVGTAYSLQLTSSGGVCPCTWTKVAGTLPTGLSLSPSGLISGTPTAAGLGTAVTFRVTDSNLAINDSSGLQFNIAATALSITSSGTAATGTQYQNYAGYTVTATGGTTPYTYSYQTTNPYASLPEGLNLNTSTGAVTNTGVLIGAMGFYGVNFIVTDSLGATASKVVNFSFAGVTTFGGCQLFPTNSIFHYNVSALPVDVSPAAPINPAYTSTALRVLFGSNAGGQGHTPNGIPIYNQPFNETNVVVTAGKYGASSDVGPFGSTCPAVNCTNNAPWSSNVPIESTSNFVADNHTLIVQSAGGGQPCYLWELYESVNSGSGPWSGAQLSFWNLSSNALRTNGVTSTDAAGLPVAPLTVNYDEVNTRTLQHPIRFTLNHILNNYVWPARHTSGIGSCPGYTAGTQIQQGASGPASCTWSGPAGEIYRLISTTPHPACYVTSPQAATIIDALYTYGIILADNGLTGGLIGTPDSRWNTTDLSCLTQLHLSDFEPVDVSGLIQNNDSGATSTPPPPTPPASDVVQGKVTVKGKVTVH